MLLELFACVGDLLSCSLGRVQNTRVDIITKLLRLQLSAGICTRLPADRSADSAEEGSAVTRTSHLFYGSSYTFLSIKAVLRK